MNIRFGEYGVRSAPIGFVLYKVSVVTGDNKRGRQAKEENIGQEREKELGNYMKLTQALDHLMNEKLRASEIATIESLFAELRKIESFIYTVKEPAPPPAFFTEDEKDEADIQQ